MENEEVKNLENEKTSSFDQNKEQQQDAINMAMKFGENATEEDVENVSKKMDKMKKGALAKVWDKVQELWAAFKSPETPLSTKSIIIGSLIYMVTPIDIIPDIIPGLGLLDDAFIIGLVFTQVMKLNKTAERISADAVNKELGYVYADSAKIKEYADFVNKMSFKDKHTKNEQREIRSKQRDLYKEISNLEKKELSKADKDGLSQLKNIFETIKVIDIPNFVSPKEMENISVLIYISDKVIENKSALRSVEEKYIKDLYEKISLLKSNKLDKTSFILWFTQYQYLPRELILKNILFIPRFTQYKFSAPKQTLEELHREVFDLFKQTKEILATKELIKEREEKLTMLGDCLEEVRLLLNEDINRE